MTIWDIQYPTYFNRANLFLDLILFWRFYLAKELPFFYMITNLSVFFFGSFHFGCWLSVVHWIVIIISFGITSRISYRARVSIVNFGLFRFRLLSPPFIESVFSKLLSNEPFTAIKQPITAECCNMNFMRMTHAHDFSMNCRRRIEHFFNFDGIKRFEACHVLSSHSFYCCKTVLRFFFVVFFITTDKHK